MRAVRLATLQQPLVQQEIPPRPPRAGEVLVRVHAAGICHSDAHYRAGISRMGALPLTLGHEVAGVIAQCGEGVPESRLGERVCLHYLLTCGECAHCAAGRESFCVRGAMLGHHVDGGFAEYVTVPARNAVALPERIGFEAGAIMMCSAATALHALRRARLAPGESVALFGTGGLGMAAVQLARAMGAAPVFAVDVRPERLALAERLGAVPVNAGSSDAVPTIRAHAGTTREGVAVALDLAGTPVTLRQSLQALAPQGRAVAVGLSRQRVEFDPYAELLGPEAELLGSNDHTLAELSELLAFAASGALDLSYAAAAPVPLEAGAINDVLDALEANRAPVRSVVVPAAG